MGQTARVTESDSWTPSMSAFEREVLPHLAGLRHRALSLERSPADASDLVQDTLERALRSFDRFRPGSKAELWLHTILFNRFIDRRRTRRRRREQALEAAAAAVPAPAPEQRADWEDVPIDDLRAAVARLDPPSRAVAQLHWFEARSYGDIGKELGVPLGTIGSRLLRARRKIRELLSAA